MSRPPAAPSAGAVPFAGRVELLGLPTDEAASFERGAAGGPGAIRAALASPASNQSTEDGLDLATAGRFGDHGDLELSGGEATRREIESAVAARLAAGSRLVCLGGDHSVAHPILAAYGPRYPGLTVVLLDAHPDLYDSLQGDRFSHACAFARVMEQGLVERLVQIGVRTLNDHQRRQAERFGVEVVPRRRWSDLARLELAPPTYLSIDLDALDPAFAPGVSHPQAGGLTTREVLEAIWRVPGLVGADLVELNPRRDVGGITAVLAAKLVKELAGRLLEG